MIESNRWLLILVISLLILLPIIIKNNSQSEGFDPNNPDDAEWLEEPIDQYDLRFLQNAGLIPSGKFSYQKFRELFNQNRFRLTRTQNTFMTNRRIIERLQHQDLQEKAVTDPNVQRIINQGQRPNQISIIPAKSNPNLCYCLDPTKQDCQTDTENCFKLSEALKNKNQLNQTSLNQLAKFYCQYFKRNKADLERRGISLEVDDSGNPFYQNCNELSPGVFRARHYPGGFGEAIQVSQWRQDAKKGDTINIWDPFEGVQGGLQR